MNPPALLLSLAISLVMAAWPSGRVLCSESGGKVEVEPQGALCCGEASPAGAADDSAPGPASGGDRCGDCRDQGLASFRAVSGQPNAPVHGIETGLRAPDSHCIATLPGEGTLLRVTADLSVPPVACLISIVLLV